MMTAIETAVMPMKADAMDRAEKNAREHIAKVLELLAAADWKVNAVAPVSANSMRMGRKDYMIAKGRRAFVDSLTSRRTEDGKEINGSTLRSDNTEFKVRANPSAVEHIVKKARDDAAAQYDAFVSKLVQKVGVHDSATLAGSHVWGHSVLTVTKRGQLAEQWKTQMIINVSKLGKLFNQFPTRLMKPAARKFSKASLEHRD